jgi:hypothetical protein
MLKNALKQCWEKLDKRQHEKQLGTKIETKTA